MYNIITKEEFMNIYYKLPSIYFEFITPPQGDYWIPNKVKLVKEK